MSSRACFTGLLSIGFGACLVSGAFADDWLMFRKDSGRVAASSDKVGLPLKTLWNWKSKRVNGQSVVSTSVVRRGDIFFIAGPKTPADEPNPKDDPSAQRFLFCMDVQTGQVKWQRPLASSRLHPYLSEDIGPAVTQGGIVYVLDMGTDKDECLDGYLLKAFSADKGKLMGSVGVPIRETLSRFFLRDGHGESNFLLTSKQKPDC